MQYVYIYMVYKGFIKSKRGLLVRGGDPGSLRMRGFACFSKALIGGRHYDSLGIRGVSHKGKERCGRYRSTISLKDKYWLLKTSTYTGTMQERQYSRLEQTGTTGTAGTAGYTAGQQDSWLDNRIRGWTTGYTAGQQDTRLDYRIHSRTAGYGHSAATATLQRQG